MWKMEDISSVKETNMVFRGSGSRIPVAGSKIPTPTRRVDPSLELPPLSPTKPLGPLKFNSSPCISPPIPEMEAPPSRGSLGPPRSRGAVRGTRGISRGARGRVATGTGAGIRRDSDSVDDDSSSTKSTPRLNPPRKPASRAYSNVRARIRVRGGRPMMKGFANVGSVFDEAKGEDLHPQIIKMARRSGQLNLSNRGMAEVPDKVYHIREMDADEAKKMMMGMSMDNSDDDKWWEQSELTRLYLSSNCLTSISPKISNLMSLQVLDLSDNSLTSLPSTICELSCLQRLNLSHNRLEDMPTGIVLLADLRSLQLDHNNLTSLARDLGNLNVLDYLDVSNNKLKELPPSIGYMQRVSKVNASYNEIKELPEEIGDCFGLTQLDLSHNQLTGLPKSMGALQKLEQLYLRYNAIQSLPLLHNCRALKELHLGYNFIKEIDAEQLNYLTGVSTLDLRDNQLDDLPDQITLLQGLERLDITNNNMSTLPSHIGLLPHLKSMPLDGNPMRLIRRDIIQRGTVQLLKYLSSRISAPVNTFPGFENTPNTPADTNLIMGDKMIPDKYQMRTTQTMAFNEKASEIPEKLIENAAEAEVRTIDISKNVLTQVPEKIETLARHVSEVMMGMNRLTSLPSYFGLFQRLQFLDVQGNQLTDLPTELGQCPYLREVNISANKFQQLPACLYEVAHLELLFAGDNKIVSIDLEGLSKLKRIATLDLHNNNIDFVPPLLGNMTQLRTLLLEGNAFRVPRTAILAKGTREILDYLRTRIVDEKS